MNRPLPYLVICATLAVFFAACAKPPVTIDRAKLASFSPLSEPPAATAPESSARIDLGRMLYYEARLSSSQEISCNTCHPLARYGADGKPSSEGHGGQRETRNSPSVYNAALQFVQFWDGRAPDVEAQAGRPLLNPVEMAMPSEAAVVHVLKSIPEYVTAFRKAYPRDRQPVTFANAAKAIGAFERGLITPSRWDRYLKGDDAALTATEKAGFNSFLEAGCAACHAGTLLGGSGFQKLGMARNYPRTSDAGRFEITHNEADRLVFKVPSLRNVAMTGPYFHDGKVPTLEDALSLMAQYQTARPLSFAETNAIVSWLRALTGDLPAEYIKPPPLPPSTAETPKPVDGD